MNEVLLFLFIWLCLCLPASAQTVHRLGGEPEGMVQALKASPMQYGCFGSVAVEVPDILF